MAKKDGNKGVWKHVIYIFLGALMVSSLGWNMYNHVSKKINEKIGGAYQAGQQDTIQQLNASIKNQIKTAGNLKLNLDGEVITLVPQKDLVENEE